MSVVLDGASPAVWVKAGETSLPPLPAQRPTPPEMTFMPWETILPDYPRASEPTGILRT